MLVISVALIISFLTMIAIGYTSEQEKKAINVYKFYGNGCTVLIHTKKGVKHAHDLSKMMIKDLDRIEKVDPKTYETISIVLDNSKDKIIDEGAILHILSDVED